MKRAFHILLEKIMNKSIKYEIQKLRYNSLSAKQNAQLNELLNNVWNKTDSSEVHPKEMNAMSFCAITDNAFIGYAGVIMWEIQIENNTFQMCGLSCVCVHPSYQGCGIGTELVRQATEWIMQDTRFDIGLFTCSPECTSFYEKNKLWEKAHNLIIKESDRDNAYQSDLLGLDVFKLLISDKARKTAGYFENRTILLNFPKGKFI